MIFQILCCLVLIVCWVYGLALLAWMIIKLDVKKRREKMNVQNIEEVQQMRWIPVEERLPEQENAQVLMTDGEGCYISSRNNMVRFLDCEGIFIPGKAGAGVKVTHWMPLPKPPKEASHD